MTIEQELAQANARITELEGDNAQVTAERDTAREQAQKNFKALTEANNTVASHAKTIGEQATEIERLDKDLSAEKSVNKSVEDRANLLAKEALAKSGHPAIDMGAEGTPAASAKPDFSKLTGLEKAIAAHQAKQLSPSK